MTIYLKQSTASQEIVLGPFVDSLDGVTAETGLTIANTDIKIWVAGATTLANKTSGGATHISGGIYSAVLDATDTATLGSLKIFVAVAGALACTLECLVLAANIYDSLIGGGDVLDVSVTQWTGTAVASPHTAGYPVVTVKDGTGTGEIDTASGLVTITTASVNAVADQVWDEALAGHATAGSAGAALTAAGVGGDPWATAVPGAYAAGTAGFIIGGALDATVSSRASQASLDATDAVVDAISTTVNDIKTKTDSLTFNVAGFIDANVQYVNNVEVAGTGAPSDEWRPT